MKDNVSKKELAWYIVSGLIMLFGIGLMITGVIGEHMGIGNNFIMDAQTQLQTNLNNRLTFRIYGIIFLLVGAFIFVAALCFNAKKTDKDVERKIRREQRINGANNINFEVKSAVQEVEETPEAK